MIVHKSWNLYIGHNHETNKIVCYIGSCLELFWGGFTLGQSCIGQVHDMTCCRLAVRPWTWEWPMVPQLVQEKNPWRGHFVFWGWKSSLLIFVFDMQLGQLLDTDMVPPAVMRHHVQVGGKTYALGTLIYFVPDVRVLTRLGPQVPTFTSSLFHTCDSTMNLTIGLRIFKVK